jgi:hypothetical protein
MSLAKRKRDGPLEGAEGLSRKRPDSLFLMSRYRSIAVCIGVHSSVAEPGEGPARAAIHRRLL